MQIGGLQKMTLLDYPGNVACTVFTVGCNFRCPFCHNTPLIAPPFEQAISEEDFFEFLSGRQKLLDGVCISGGEPLLHDDIFSFAQRIKEMGFKVKLDTNGSFPDRLEKILSSGLTDYVAMDIKNSPSKYSLTAGADNILGNIKESAEILKSSGTEYEFRTTVVSELHSDNDFKEIGRWLAGTERYFLQSFIDSGAILSGGMSAPDSEDMQKYLQTVREYIPNAQLRGI